MQEALTAADCNMPSLMESIQQAEPGLVVELRVDVFAGQKLWTTVARALRSLGLDEARVACCKAQTARTKNPAGAPASWSWDHCFALDVGGELYDLGGATTWDELCQQTRARRQISQQSNADEWQTNYYRLDGETMHVGPKMGLDHEQAARVAGVVENWANQQARNALADQTATAWARASRRAP